MEKISQVLGQVGFCDGSGNDNVCGRATLPIRTDVVSRPMLLFSLDEDFSTEYVEPVLSHGLLYRKTPLDRFIGLVQLVQELFKAG